MEKKQKTIDELLADARETYSAFGRSERALALVDRVLAQEPDHLEALNLKATLLYDLDRDEEATAYHQRALEVEPNSVEALHGLASLANDHAQYAQALTLAERGFAAIPHDPDPELAENEDYRQRLVAELYNEKAFALWYLGRRDDAVHTLTIDGPQACPLEIETFEDELDWLEHHPDSPDEE